MMDPPATKKRKIEEGKEEEAPGPSTSTSMEEQTKTKTESEGAPESVALVKFSGFSRAAIDSLKEVLLGEDDDDIESKNRRSIYIKIAVNSSARRQGIVEGWLRLEANDVGESLGLTLSPSCVYPPQLQGLVDFGCAAWGSRIIIAGGGTLGRASSNEVYAYKTDTDEWEQLPPMIAERGCEPYAIVADGMIFVFGGNPQHDEIYGVGEELARTTILLWAEYYDSKSPQPSWKRLPQTPPIELLQYPTCSFTPYTVYTKGSVILFYTGHLVSFNYSTWEWRIYETQDHPIARCPEWSVSVALVDHFLFWHDDKTVYGHDLLSGSRGAVLPVFSFEDTSHFCHPMHDFSGVTFIYHPTFLVRVGRKDELCLLWHEKKNTVRYFIFRIYICQNAARIRLLLTQTGLLESTVSRINFALEVSV